MKTKSAKALFITACVFFVISTAVNVYFLFINRIIANGISSGDVGKAFGSLLAFIVVIAMWVLGGGISGVLSIIFSAFSVKHYKIASIIFLIVTVGLLAANILIVFTI